MNELHDMGPNTAHLNQKPENPFSPGDRVIKEGDADGSVAVVVEVLPPEQNVAVYGQEMDGEAINVTFPNLLDDGPGNWREIHPAKLGSYCDDQGIKLYTYKHTNLAFAENPFIPGDHVIKPDYPDPDLAVVVDVGEEGIDDRDVSIVFRHHLEEELGERASVPPAELAAQCDESSIRSYTYDCTELSFKAQY